SRSARAFRTASSRCGVAREIESGESAAPAGRRRAHAFEAVVPNVGAIEIEMWKSPFRSLLRRFGPATETDASVGRRRVRSRSVCENEDWSEFIYETKVNVR